MIGSVLIANRGEIARRVIRTARRMGIRTVAVYSDADVGSPHVREADAAVCVGPAPARDSYLDGDKIIAAARATGAEAIHPGYGFLSENAAFAAEVISAGLTWIGPPPAAILAMGMKDAAKRLMAEAGVPVTPGYLGEDQSPERLFAEAEAVGYPVLIKAVAGGGGKGMRRVDEPADFRAALDGCRREAASSFGDDRVLIERYAARPRHIEVQVFADAHGDVVHLFERDCSVQRRHQKVIEEAPAPGMDEATRAAVCGAAVKAAQAVGYQGAGTVEFIADASDGLRPDRIWFMEMNTRLQVEHPVTEAIAGEDLVEWQFRIAAGEPLPKRQDELAIDGWAMEARLYAEDPQTGFLPSTGPLTRFHIPMNVRADAGVEEGGVVTPFYDPMLAKLVARAPTRAMAAERLAAACAGVEVWPVKTNAGFLARVLSHPDFLEGRIDTGFIEAHLADLTPPAAPSAEVLGTAAVVRLAQWWDAASPWGALTGFRLNAPPDPRVALQVEGRSVLAHPVPSPHLHRLVDGDTVVVFEAGEAYAFGEPGSGHADDEAGASGGAVASPMPGRVVAVHVREGDAVEKGAALITVEAMKMEHTLAAPVAGRVEGLTVEVGAQVAEGAALALVVAEGEV